MFKNLIIISSILAIFSFTGCEAPKNSAMEAAQEAAIAEAKADAKAAMDKANAAAGTADRAEAMTEQNRSALRALNDKIDRMFRTISRK